MVIKGCCDSGQHFAIASCVVWSRNKMATASTALLTAIVALAFGNLQMIDAAIYSCTDATEGLTNNGSAIGLLKYDLGTFTLEKYVKYFKIRIPTNTTCPVPVGVSIRVCDFPAGIGMKLPVVTFDSLDVAYARVSLNHDLLVDDFALISVYCVPAPWDR